MEFYGDHGDHQLLMIRVCNNRRHLTQRVLRQCRGFVFLQYKRHLVHFNARWWITSKVPHVPIKHLRPTN